jgi:hypothetical protein
MLGPCRPRMNESRPGRVVNQLRVVVGRHADENSRRTARERARRVAGIFQRFPSDFKHQPLLRVHRGSFTRGNSKKTRIKLIDVLQQSSVPVGVASGLPAAQSTPAGRHCSDSVHAVFENTPVAFEIAHAAGKTAARSYERDRFVQIRTVSAGELPLQALHFGFERVDGGKGLPQQFAMPTRRCAIRAHLGSNRPF